MTSEQLQSARAERWRQVSNPLVTAEDARAWLEGVGFCLFSPKRTSGIAFAPAPSFVEAVAGAVSEVPAREAVERATELLHRLTAEGAIVPLNLLTGGAPVAGGVDQPDYVVTREALPYVFSLIGGRNWKSGPGGKASPLMTEVWTLLNDGEARTAQEIRTSLGRELTEAAVLRALVELWNGLRVIPVYDGETTKWELTQGRFAAEMTTSQKVAQVTALSAMVSLYLDTVVAASSEEIETYLSPLASRSRVREVVNGLSATRQIALVSVGAHPLFHVAGALPEFAEEAVPAERVESEAVEKKTGEPRRFEERPRFENRGAEFERWQREDRPQRKPFERANRREDRAGPRERRNAGRTDDRREGRGASRGEPGKFARTGRRPLGKPWERKSGAGDERGVGKREFGQREPGDRERRPFGKKPFEKQGKPFGQRRFDERGLGRGEGRSGGKFPPKRFEKSGEGAPWRDGGERRGFEKPERRGERSEFRPRREEGRENERGGRFSSEKRFGAKKKFGGPPRFGEKRPFAREHKARGEQEGRGEREERGSMREGRPPFKPGGKPGFGGRKNFGERGAGKGGFGKRQFGEPGTEGRGFSGGGKSGFKKSGFGKSAKPFGESRKPFGERGKSFRKPDSPFEKSAKPFGKAGKNFGKPKFGRPGKSSGKPGFCGSKPVGFKPPFRRRKKDESEQGE